MRNDVLVATGNDTLNDVTEFSGLSEGYCSFKEYYGRIIKSAQDNDCDTFVDETIYFRALVKLGIISKAKIISGSYILDGDRNYLPPEKEALVLQSRFKRLKDEFIPLGVYMMKRGPVGFNCASDDIDAMVKEPLVAALCAFNRDMVKKSIEVNEAKVVLKERGLPLNLVNLREAKTALINKHFA